ncbi:MAG: sialate O-acetylesterase [Myxococcales bacterium]|nr:sialate O-acetylesterase [Myxococcales bacterium]
MALPRPFAHPHLSIALAGMLAWPACTSGTDVEPSDPVDVVTTPPTESTADTGLEDTGLEDTGPVEEISEVQVFLLAGQSNMTGRADELLLPAHLQQAQADVQLFYSGGGKLDPEVLLPLQPGSGTDVGPEVSLGRTLADLSADESIVLIKHAVGGTNLVDDWDPVTGPQYQTFSDTVSAGLAALVKEGHTPVIRGVAWLQGEADVRLDRTTSEYAADLAELIEAVRADFAPGDELRFVVGRLSDVQFTSPDLQVSREAIQAAQDIAAALPNVAVIDTDGLRTFDVVHYDAQSQQTLGTLFARALLDEPQTSDTARFDFGVTGQAPDLEEPGWTQLQLSESGSSQAIQAVDPATGWTVTLESAGSNVIGRNRSPLDAQVDSGFTLEAVYVDFITGWEHMTIGNLDPSRSYDVQIMMFDDDGQLGRTQTLTHTGDDVELGTTDGPGTAGEGQLTDDLVYSITATELTPDADGTLTFRCANSGTNNRCLSNGVVLSEN